METINLRDVAYNATGKVINVSSRLNVRSTPSTSGSVVGTVANGQTVKITAKNGSWYKISSPIAGYVHGDYIQITSTGDVAYSATGKVINISSRLNVRSTPSTSGSVVGTIGNGQVVNITAKNGSWYKISSPMTGYVHSDYIQITSTGGNGDVPYNANGTVVNVSSTLNVRSKPSTSGTVVGSLRLGTSVKITAKNGSWYKISSPIAGYVHGDYISVGGTGGGDGHVTIDDLKALGWTKLTPEMIADLNRCLTKYGITTRMRICHFISQCSHESSGGYYTEEIASGEDYENRPDLGNIYPGDGPKYKGGGYLQLTGRYNYQGFSNAMGDKKIIDIGVTYVAKYYAWSSAGYWWDNNSMNRLVDSGASVEDVTRKVNGGLNGLESRKQWFNKCLSVFK